MTNATKDHAIQAADLAATGVRILDESACAARDPGLDPHTFGAAVAAMPGTVAEVASVIRWCADRGIGVVPHGGRTGLAGGAVSAPGQVVLMMERMNRIIDIDPAAAVAVVEAGAPLGAVEAAAAAHGLSLGIDIAARDSCTIGGMVATNAGGSEAFRNGVMRHRVLGLEAVMPDGAVFSDLKRVIKANEGLDIKQLLIGAEGTLGVITKVSLRLSPATGLRETALIAADTASDAVAVLRRLQALTTPRLLSAEVMWRDYFRATIGALGIGGGLDRLRGDVFLLVDCAAGEAACLPDILGPAAEAGEIRDAVFPKNEAERRDLWRIREDTFQIDRLHPGGCWFDVSVPLARLDGYVATVRDRVARVVPGAGIFIVGHLGDGNLHFTITGDAPLTHLYDPLCHALCEGLPEMGGSFSAEHGIGLEKRGTLARFGDPTKRALMAAVKAALDPRGIMNPGKLF